MAENEVRVMNKKICLIGNSKVGKTSLLKRYVSDEFLDRYIATISAKIFKKDIQVKVGNNGDSKLVNMTLSIWDLIGHRDRNSAMSSRCDSSLESNLDIAQPI